jgi:hypothetical protein
VIVVGRDDGIVPYPGVDPGGTVVFHGSARDVDTVLVGGVAVKRGGALCGTDVRPLVEQAERAAVAVLERAHRLVPRLPPPPPFARDDVERMVAENLRARDR